MPIAQETKKQPWQLGGPKGWVTIRAENEKRAREIAQKAFGKTKVGTHIHSTNWASLDWSNPDVVRCLYQADDVSGTEGIIDMD